MNRHVYSQTVAALLLLAGAQAAHAHTGVGPVTGLASGLLHPMIGLDHMLAMLAVGIWAAQLGGKRQWQLPFTFVAVMLAGAALAWTGLTLPAVEPGLAASIVILGLLIAAQTRLPAGVPIAIVAIFAILHGHAHGSELAPGMSALTYATGFAATTLALHLTGIAIGKLFHMRALALRALGATLAGTGALLFAVA